MTLDADPPPVGIAGAGAIGLASAAWLAHSGCSVTLWPPRRAGGQASREASVQSRGVVEASGAVCLAASAAQLCRQAQVLLIAVPVNGHRDVIEALLPNLRDGQVVIVSSMNSLSALLLYEAACRAGRDITVASFGSTVFTARREGPLQVRVLTHRAALGVSVLPLSRTPAVITLCQHLFGDSFSAHENTLASALANANPVAHVPLALFNWTRIERAEAWPQYHCMTPQVAAVVEQLDAERLALARAFGLRVRSVAEHLAQSFSNPQQGLAEIAAELHRRRGGPPGPTDTGTRFITEDVPYGLVFNLALGRITGVPMPATQAMVNMASMISGREFGAENNLLGPLELSRETVAGLLARVAVDP